MANIGVKSKDLGELAISTPEDSKKNEPVYPTIFLQHDVVQKIPGLMDYKVGDKIEAEVTFCIKSRTDHEDKDKDGTPDVTMDLSIEDIEIEGDEESPAEEAGESKEEEADEDAEETPEEKSDKEDAENKAKETKMLGFERKTTASKVPKPRAKDLEEI